MFETQQVSGPIAPMQVSGRRPITRCRPQGRTVIDVLIDDANDHDDHDDGHAHAHDEGMTSSARD